MSVWAGIERQEFEHKVSELERLAPSQDVAHVSIPPTVQARDLLDNSSPIPQSREKQLVHDLAFLAAWKNTPDCVTAATVVADTTVPKVTINLAANTRIATQVRDAFQLISSALEECAKCTITRDATAHQCLRIVLDLQQNRILGRLGSARYDRSKEWTRKDFVPMSPRLGSIANELRGFNSNPDIDALIEDINNLKQAIEAIETCSKEGITETLLAVVKAAYETSIDGTSFTKRLRTAGCGLGCFERKEVRQTHALANYWRSCINLSYVARRYRNTFSSCSVNVVPAYPRERWPPRSGKKHYVHAEIQLLIYHETCKDLGRPEFIGVSKKACFLCNSFIQAYGFYSISKTHGEVHSKWTIPENAHYDESTKLRIMQALTITLENVSQALENAKRSKRRHGPQVQSAVASEVPSLSTVSASTIRPNQPSKSSENNPIKDPSLTEPASEGNFRCQQVDATVAQYATSSSTDSDVTLRDNVDGGFYCITHRNSTVLNRGWLTVHAEIEPPNDFREGEEHGRHGFCRVTRHTESESDVVPSMARIDTSELADGVAVTLNRQDRTPSFNLVLTSPGRMDIRLELLWSKTLM